MKKEEREEEERQCEERKGMRKNIQDREAGVKQCEDARREVWKERTEAET